MSKLAQIFYDDVATTWTIASSVGYAPMPGSTLYTGETNDWDAYRPDPFNTTSARIVVGNKGKGVARVQWSASFSGDAGNNTYHIAVFRNGTKMGNLAAERKLGTAGDIGNANAHGFVVARVNDYIDLRANADGTTGVQFTFNHCCINVEVADTSTTLGMAV